MTDNTNPFTGTRRNVFAPAYVDLLTDGQPRTVDQWIEWYGNRLQDLWTGLFNLKGICASNSSNIATNQASIEALQKAVQQAQSDIGDLQNRMGTVEADNTSFKANVANQLSAFSGQISTLAGSVNALTQSVNQNTTDLTNFKASIDMKTIQEAVQTFQNFLPALQQAIKDYDNGTILPREQAITAAVNNEVLRASGVEGDLSNQISKVAAQSSNWNNASVNRDNALQDAINAEAARAENAEGVNADNIKAEQTRAEAAESVLTTNLTTECQERCKADTQLQANIDAEAAARALEDGKLQDNIDAETVRAEQMETGLNGRIDDAVAQEAKDVQKLASDIATAEAEAKTYTDTVGSTLSKAIDANAATANNALNIANTAQTTANKAWDSINNTILPQQKTNTAGIAANTAAIAKLKPTPYSGNFECPAFFCTDGSTLSTQQSVNMLYAYVSGAGSNETVGASIKGTNYKWASVPLQLINGLLASAVWNGTTWTATVYQ